MLLSSFQGKVAGNWAMAGHKEDVEGQEPQNRTSFEQLVLNPEVDGKLSLTQDHPNIVKMYEMFEDNSHYYMVTEYL